MSRTLLIERPQEPRLEGGIQATVKRFKGKSQEMVAANHNHPVDQLSPGVNG
jgi:hypothetical protein